MLLSQISISFFLFFKVSNFDYLCIPNFGEKKPERSFKMEPL